MRQLQTQIQTKLHVQMQLASLNLLQDREAVILLIQPQNLLEFAYQAHMPGQRLMSAETAQKASIAQLFNKLPSNALKGTTVMQRKRLATYVRQEKLAQHPIRADK